MRVRARLTAIGIGVLLGLIALIAINSRLGVDSDETFTDAHRPEIVGPRGLAP